MKAAVLLLVAAALSSPAWCRDAAPAAGYFDNTGRADVETGGVRMLPVTTPKGTFHVWTKRVGNNPRIKLLLLHGGADLGRIATPTLVIGARHDTMDPAHMEMMARKLPQGRYLFCPNAGHLAMYDDPQIYIQGLIKFLKDVDAGKKMR